MCLDVKTKDLISDPGTSRKNFKCLLNFLLYIGHGIHDKIRKLVRNKTIYTEIVSLCKDTHIILTFFMFRLLMEERTNKNKK